jgi:hypothetical protein
MSRKEIHRVLVCALSCAGVVVASAAVGNAQTFGTGTGGPLTGDEAALNAYLNTVYFGTPSGTGTNDAPMLAPQNPGVNSQLGFANANGLLPPVWNYQAWNAASFFPDNRFPAQNGSLPYKVLPGGAALENDANGVGGAGNGQMTNQYGSAQTTIPTTVPTYGGVSVGTRFGNAPVGTPLGNLQTVTEGNPTVFNVGVGGSGTVGSPAQFGAFGGTYGGPYGYQYHYP